jgi:hypothetical protein
VARTLILDIGLFEPRCGDRRGWSERKIFALLDILIESNIELMQCGRFPALYQSGLRWKAEPDRGGEDGQGVERFGNYVRALRDGHADCEDLAAIRVAELRHYAQEPAFPILKVWDIDEIRGLGVPVRGRGLLYHVQVVRVLPGGARAIEDPSVALGMPESAAENALDLAVARARLERAIRFDNRSCSMGRCAA